MSSRGKGIIKHAENAYVQLHNRTKLDVKGTPESIAHESDWPL